MLRASSPWIAISYTDGNFPLLGIVGGAEMVSLCLPPLPTHHQLISNNSAKSLAHCELYRRDLVFM